MLGITYDYEGHQFQWDVSTLKLFNFYTFYPQAQTIAALNPFIFLRTLDL